MYTEIWFSKNEGQEFLVLCLKVLQNFSENGYYNCIAAVINLPKIF